MADKEPRDVSKTPPSESLSSSVQWHDAVEKLLRDLHNGDILKDYTLGTQNDAALNGLSIKDLLKLHQAQARLVLKSHDKSLDVFLCT